MEEPLLPKLSSKKEEVIAAWSKSSGFLQDLKKVSMMAGPMVVVTVSQFLLQVVSLIMVGHLDQLSLAGVALATSFADVTGFSILIGLAGALETLCGQSFGAEQYHKLGSYTFCAIVSLILSCIPISILWIFMDKLLVLLGQDHAISQVAGKYCIWLIPSLFGYAALQALIRYFQTQTLIFPMLVISVIVLILHIPICWVLVFPFGLGRDGAALSISISYYLTVILFGLYIKYSPACQRSKIVIGMIPLSSIKEFFFLAIPSALMVCLNLCNLHFFIPYGVGAAVSTRVSNELGAGKPKEARDAVFAVIILATLDAIILSSALFCCRHVLGFAFSNDLEVVHSVAKIVPLLCLSVCVDSFLGVLSGVARGAGWQKIGAVTNLLAYYAIGIPVALLLGFVLKLNAKGLWIGILTGSTTQTLVLALLTAFTKWEKQAPLATVKTSESDAAGS